MDGNQETKRSALNAEKPWWATKDLLDEECKRRLELNDRPKKIS